MYLDDDNNQEELEEAQAKSLNINQEHLAADQGRFGSEQNTCWIAASAGMTKLRTVYNTILMNVRIAQPIAFCNKWVQAENKNV